MCEASCFYFAISRTPVRKKIIEIRRKFCHIYCKRYVLRSAWLEEEKVENDKERAVSGEEMKLIRRTRIFLIVIAAAGFVTCLSGPRLVERLMNRHSPLLTGAPRYWGMLIGGFLCALLLFRLLFILYRMLLRIEKGRVLTHANVTALDDLSLCCICAALLTGLMGCLCLLSLLAICLAAVFMMVILRVLRHAFAGAVREKEAYAEKR